MGSANQNPVRAASVTLLNSLPGLTPTFLVVAMLACMLVPLPTLLVDLLLSASLAGSVLLLVGALAVRRKTDFIAFPSLLLLATLYRLTLNISTTRLILSQADAGRVIDAFSEFVVRGDLVVGGVMFAIITLVQFVVIARGSERVAEVGARFALDGLQGQQAAIDADFRSGIISATEAAKRRADVVERSNFHGAMDGTVRFVRGDAIAGVAITGVNLVGGLLIGVGRHGMTWADSLDAYGRLTIGDGLLSQIPALLVSLAAGVLVARVDRGDPIEHRGFAHGWFDPPMLFVPSLLLLGLAFVPSMPKLAFGVTGVILTATAIVLVLRAEAERRPVLAANIDRRITVHLRPSDVNDPRVLTRALAEVRLQCAAALAIEVPHIELVLEAERRQGTLDVRIEGRRCGQTSVRRGREGEDHVVLTTFRVVMDNASSLVDLQRLDRLVEQVRATHPTVVKRALETVELTDVLAIVRGLLHERVSLPPIHAILGVVADGQRFRDASERASFPEIVRARLAQHWVPETLDALRRLGPPRFVQLTEEAEGELVDRFSVASDRFQIALSESERRVWIEHLRLVAKPEPRVPLVVIATPKARRPAAAAFMGITPFVPVLSTAELLVAQESFDPLWLDVPFQEND